MSIYRNYDNFDIFFAENKRKFSDCSKEAMKAKLEELPVDKDNVDCFRDTPYDKSFPELEISLCGNGKIEIGEACDCGMNQKE